MASTKPRLTAVQRAKRKKIKALIQVTRIVAGEIDDLPRCRSVKGIKVPRLLDELADVAEEYLKGLK